MTDTRTFQIHISGRAVFLIKPFSYCSLPKSKLGCKRLNRCNTFTPDDVREPLYPSNRWADLLASKFGMTSKVYHVKPDAISTLQFCKNAPVFKKAITEMCKENMRFEPLPAPAFCSWHLFPQSEEPNVKACFWNDFKDEIWCLLCLSRKTAEQQKREDDSYCRTENESPVDLSMHVCLAGPHPPAMLWSIFQRDHDSFSNYCCWQNSIAGKWDFRNVFILHNPYEIGPSSNTFGEQDT